MKAFNFENQAKNLPDVFAKSVDSNNYKILSIEKYVVNDFREDVQDVDDSLNLNNATGKTLDLYGEMLNQPRGVATDKKYILLIRAKIMRNLSSGDYPSVLHSICTTLNCDPSQVYIEEDENEPCTVKMITVPMHEVNTAGLTNTQLVALVKSLLPVGIRVESTLIEGTFEFSNKINDVSNTAGFGDLNNDTVGGYFGELVGEDEQQLPI